jgi:zinc transport system permease protein
MIFLFDPLVVKALLTALFVSTSAPIIGIFIVQRNMSLMGDAISHISLSGVALGWVLGTTVFKSSVPDKYVIPATLVIAILGAIILELIRPNISGDLAIGVLLYGGMALGVFLIKINGGSSANLIEYLFGSLSIVSNLDVLFTFFATLLVLSILLGFKWVFWTINNDQEYAKSLKLPIKVVNILFSCLCAISVVASIKVVGVLLVGALMILPVAISKQLSHSLNSSIIISIIFSVIFSVLGVLLTYFIDIPPGATIVLLLITVFLIVSIIKNLLKR